MLEARAKLLHERLTSLADRVMEIKGLVLIDPNGLPMVSTLHSQNLEEALGAFGASAVGQMERAQTDFEMGPLYLLHLAGRDRQLFVTPLTPEVALLAIAEAGATASTVTLHLLGLCREILAVLQSDNTVDDGTEDGAMA
jgi:predicted regulator of Ras-like GTPase activity (Roadblock/LC7/MglB family)